MFIFGTIIFQMTKIKLHIAGLSFSKMQDNAYVLILAESAGTRRIPIIIGGVEAQAIAMEIENLHAPRPLTHDLFYSLASKFDITLTEVYIYKLQEGIFYSKIVAQQHDVRIELDSRTSDAVALAIRFKCPIYAEQSVVDRAGIDIEAQSESADDTADETEESEFTMKDNTELQDLLQIAINNEDYERASLIRDELKKRNL
jgi:bifunctional DNase/RNase